VNDVPSSSHLNVHTHHFKTCYAENNHDINGTLRLSCYCYSHVPDDSVVKYLNTEIFKYCLNTCTLTVEYLSMYLNTKHTVFVTTLPVDSITVNFMKPQQVSE